MRISDWSSDVCSSDLLPDITARPGAAQRIEIIHKKTVQQVCILAWGGLRSHLARRRFGLLYLDALGYMSRCNQPGRQQTKVGDTPGQSIEPSARGRSFFFARLGGFVSDPLD